MTLTFFTAASIADAFGRIPKALSLGLIALNATGASAANSEYASVLGSVTPDMYSASAAPRTDRPYDASSAFVFSFIYFPPRILYLL